MAQEMVQEQGEFFHSLSKEAEDLLREAVGRLVQEVMEEEVRGLVGAGLHERSPECTKHRNGYRDRRRDTRVGSIPLRIPTQRKGSYCPSFLEPRRRAERALVSVVQEAHVHGVSTRSVDALVQALGSGRLDKSAVSRMCRELHEEAEDFRTRPIDEEIVYVWLDALYERLAERVWDPQRVLDEVAENPDDGVSEGPR